MKKKKNRNKNKWSPKLPPGRIKINSTAEGRTLVTYVWLLLCKIVDKELEEWIGGSTRKINYLDNNNECNASDKSFEW